MREEYPQHFFSKWLSKWLNKSRKAAPPERHPDREKALLGLAYYERVDDGNYWILRPHLRLLIPVVVGFVSLVYVTAASCKYGLERYIYGCEATPYWDMYIYVIPNRIPFTNFVFLPDFLNRFVMDARFRQQHRISLMVAKDPQNLYELFYAARTQPKNIEIQFQAAYFLAAPEWQNRLDEAFDVLDHVFPVILDEKETASRNISRYVRFCFQYEQDDRLIRACETYLNDPRLSPESRANLATAYCEALYLKGRFTDASEALDRYNLLTVLPGFLLKTRIIWENGEYDRALTLIKHFSETSGEGQERLLYTHARFLREQNKFGEAALLIGKIANLNPNDFKSRVQQLFMLQKANDKLRLTDGIEDVFTRFSSSEEAMLALGDFAAEQGDVELQKRIEALALENRFPNLSSFRLLIIETLVTAGRHSEALEQIGDLFMRKPIWLQKNKVVQVQFESLRVLAYFANGQVDLGVVALGRLMREDLSIPVSVATARRLLILNRPEDAKRILLQAYTRNHNNQSVLLELVKMDLKSESTETLGEYLNFLLAGRRPPRYVLNEAIEHFGSDRFLFTPNRDTLLAKMDDMLRTLVLPVSAVEKDWPGSPGTGGEAPVKPLPLPRKSKR
jgi:hypothetical protein